MSYLVIPIHETGDDTGTILRWYKAPGDWVLPGERLFAYQVPSGSYVSVSELEGRLAEIFVDENQSVPLPGDVALLLAKEDEAPPAPEQLPLAKEDGLYATLVDASGLHSAVSALETARRVHGGPAISLRTLLVYCVLRADAAFLGLEDYRGISLLDLAGATNDFPADFAAIRVSRLHFCAPQTGLCLCLPKGAPGRLVLRCPNDADAAEAFLLALGDILEKEPV